MALPIIIVDSTAVGSSDTLASGAGPGDGTTGGSALTGSSASTDGTGLVVTLDGSPDLTNVATDGSHVIFIVDTTAGARNFGKITAKDNGAKTVTVSNAFGLSISGKTWAIGGKRASIGSTTSRKLLENNAASGDAMPGWIVEMKSGHAETITTAITLRRSGDVTDGPIILRGELGAAIKPIITASGNINGFNSVTNLTRWAFWDFSIAHAGTAGGTLMLFSNTSNMSFRRLTIGGGASLANAGIVFEGTGSSLYLCEIHNVANSGVSVSDGTAEMISHCRIHDCGWHGITSSNSNASSQLISHNLIYDCTLDGINLPSTNGGVKILHNIIDGCGSDGIELGNVSGAVQCQILYNIISNCVGVGMNFSGSPLSLAITDFALVDFNAFYNNTSHRSPSNIGVNNQDLSADPYIDRASGDFNLNDTAGGGAVLRALANTLPG